MTDKYKYIKCNNCLKAGGVIAKGRVFGNYGKKQFECSHCNHKWQYGK